MIVFICYDDFKLLMEQFQDRGLIKRNLYLHSVLSSVMKIYFGIYWAKQPFIRFYCKIILNYTSKVNLDALQVTKL